MSSAPRQVVVAEHAHELRVSAYLRSLRSCGFPSTIRPAQDSHRGVIERGASDR